MTLREWMGQASRRLEAVGIESHRLEAQLLAAHTLMVDRTWIVAHPEAEINELAAETLLERRVAREPLAYILGYREFFGRKFEVGPGVLIPRQDTEVLLEAALGIVDRGPVLDLGTGSGCLAVSLKLERPEVEVWASDISQVALEIAERNAQALRADVRFLKSDGFKSLPEFRFEVVVSNPPYIGDTEELMPEVRDHEPKSALFSGPSGLEFYERLAKEAAGFLVSGGKLALEVGQGQAQLVAELLTGQGWSVNRVVADLGGIDRVVVAERRWGGLGTHGQGAHAT